MKRTYLKILTFIPCIIVLLALFVLSATMAVESKLEPVVMTDAASLAAVTYISDEASPEGPPLTPTPQKKASRYRDDIISDGNLLSYENQEIMQECSEKYDVPYALLIAIADTESRFEADAASNTNDYGLMQINKCNHEWLLEIGIDPTTPAGNIEAGAYIIAGHLDKYIEIERALMAYNCGATGASKLWNSGVYHTDYSRKVMAAFEHWTNVLEE